MACHANGQLCPTDVCGNAILCSNYQFCSKNYINQGTTIGTTGQSVDIDIDNNLTNKKMSLR